MEYFRDYTTDKEALIQPPFKTVYTTFKKYYILLNNKRANNKEYNSYNGEKTGRSASATFFHEVLDEFFNYFTKKTVNYQSPQIVKIQYQNAALRNLRKTERDGSHHQ